MQNRNFQSVDLYSPILAARKGKPPVILRVGVQDKEFYTIEGPQNSPIKSENYILLSALPDELRRRVETAVQTIISSI